MDYTEPCPPCDPSLSLSLSECSYTSASTSSAFFAHHHVTNPVQEFLSTSHTYLGEPAPELPQGPYRSGVRTSALTASHQSSSDRVSLEMEAPSECPSPSPLPSVLMTQLQRARARACPCGCVRAPACFFHTGSTAMCSRSAFASLEGFLGENRTLVSGSFPIACTSLFFYFFFFFSVCSREDLDSVSVCSY